MLRLIGPHTVAASTTNVEPLELHGTTAAIGGAFSSPAIFSAMLDAAGRGRRPRLAVVLSSKAGSPAARAAYFRDQRKDGQVIDPSIRRWFSDQGFDPIYIPLTVDNFEAYSHDRRLAEQIASCDAVYLAGGDQAHHVRCLLDGDGSDTPVLSAIKSVAAKGGLVAGSSAGAAAQGSLQYGEGSVYGYLVENRLVEHAIEQGTLRNRDEPEVGSIQRGLALLEHDALVCTHFDQRYRLGRLLVAMRAADLPGIGVDEDTGLFVKGNEGRIIGSNGVFFADASRATYGTGPYFAVEGVELDYLTHGDRVELDTKAAISSKPESSARVGGVLVIEDVLAPRRLTEMIESMVRTGAERAVGYTKQEDPRFEIELTRGPNTRMFDDGRRVSAVGLRVSVRPV